MKRFIVVAIFSFLPLLAFIAVIYLIDPSGRFLTSAEKEYAKTIFHDSIDVKSVHIARDTLLSAGSPKTLGNTIHVKSNRDYFSDGSELLEEPEIYTLTHELAHVWQYQNGGWAYVPKSLLSQFFAYLRTGTRSGAYKWREAHNVNTPWNTWNPEQQAALIEEYARAVRQGVDLETFEQYMMKVWAREGTP